MGLILNPQLPHPTSGLDLSADVLIGPDSPVELAQPEPADTLHLGPAGGDWTAAAVLPAIPGDEWTTAGSPRGRLARPAYSPAMQIYVAFRSAAGSPTDPVALYRFAFTSISETPASVDPSKWGDTFGLSPGSFFDPSNVETFAMPLGPYPYTNNSDPAALVNSPSFPGNSRVEIQVFDPTLELHFLGVSFLADVSISSDLVRQRKIPGNVRQRQVPGVVRQRQSGR